MTYLLVWFVLVRGLLQSPAVGINLAEIHLQKLRSDNTQH